MVSFSRLHISQGSFRADGPSYVETRSGSVSAHLPLSRLREALWEYNKAISFVKHTTALQIARKFLY